MIGEWCRVSLVEQMENEVCCMQDHIQGGDTPQIINTSHPTKLLVSRPVLFELQLGPVLISCVIPCVTRTSYCSHQSTTITTIMAKETTTTPKATKEELENLEEDDEFEEFEAVGMHLSSPSSCFHYISESVHYYHLLLSSFYMLSLLFVVINVGM